MNLAFYRAVPKPEEATRASLVARLDWTYLGNNPPVSLNWTYLGNNYPNYLHSRWAKIECECIGQDLFVCLKHKGGVSSKTSRTILLFKGCSVDKINQEPGICRNGSKYRFTLIPRVHGQSTYEVERSATW